MNLTRDEHRALAFIAALLCLSAAVRLVGLPEPVAVPESAGPDLAGQIEAVEEAVAAEEERSRPLESGETIDPNTATADELMRLPGVGPALAARIVADREAHGRYRSLADLTRVAGVGERTAQRLAPHVGLPDDSRDARSSAIRSRSRASPSPARRTAPAGPGPRIDLNRADVAELTALPGIGPVLAARIVAYRDSAGPFRDLSDLEAVKGVGPATVVRISDRVLIK